MVREKTALPPTSEPCTRRARCFFIYSGIIISGCILVGGMLLIRETTKHIRENLTITTASTSIPTHSRLSVSRPRRSLFSQTPRTVSQSYHQIQILRKKSRILGRVANEIMQHRDFDRNAQADIYTFDEEIVPRKQDHAGTDNFIYGEGTGRSLGELKRYICLQIDHFTWVSISYADVWSPEEGDSILVYRSDLSLMHILPRADGKIDIVIDVRLRHFSAVYAQLTEIDEDQFDVFLRMKDTHEFRFTGLDSDDVRPVIKWYLDNLECIEHSTYRDRDIIAIRLKGLPYGETKQMVQTILVEYLQDQFAMNPYHPIGAH